MILSGLGFRYRIYIVVQRQIRFKCLAFSLYFLVCLNHGCPLLAKIHPRLQYRLSRFPLSFLIFSCYFNKLIMDSVIGLSNYLIKKHLQLLQKPLLYTLYIYHTFKFQQKNTRDQDNCLINPLTYFCRSFIVIKYLRYFIFPFLTFIKHLFITICMLIIPQNLVMSQ